MIPANTLAALCAETYQKPAHVTRPGLHVIFTPAGGAYQAIIAAFRGSADLEDWVLNFRQHEVRSVKYPKLDVMPEGFADDVLDAYAELRNGLTGYDHVVLTGHSRGGAQAQIFGALLTSDGVPIAQIETFGCPRVGRLGTMIAPTPGFDWINGNDPVPAEPFWAMPARWAQRYIGAKREMIPTEGKDHHMAAYQAALAK